MPCRNPKSLSSQLLVLKHRQTTRHPYHLFDGMRSAHARSVWNPQKWATIRMSSLRGLASISAPNTSRPANAALSPRWLSDLKQRVGKCIIFGLTPPQVDEAGRILRTVARDWRELVAGIEGFLVGRNRAELERYKVNWGEMVR